MTSKQWDLEQKFPIFKLKIGFIRKFFHFFHKLENSENLFIQAYKCAKFQQKIFSEKKWHPSSGILSKNFQFSNLNSDFIGKFSDFQHSSKFVKNNTLGPLSVRSFSKIQRETFEVEIFSGKVEKFPNKSDFKS